MLTSIFLAATLATALPAVAQTVAWGRSVVGTGGAITTPGDGQVVTRTLAVDAAGNAIVTGTMGSGASGDFVTAKINASTGAIVWQKTFAGAGANEDDAYAVAVDAAGNAIVAGLSYTTASNIDIKVIKYAAADGSVLWQRTIDAGPYDAAYAVCVDAGGNAIVAAESSNASSNIDIHVLKLAAADGATQWDKAFDGGKDDFVSDLAVDAAGNAIVIGESVNASGNDDMRVIKYAAADGALVWNQSFGSTGADEAYAVAVDAAGNVFVTGVVPGASAGDARTMKLAAATGAVMWQQTYDGGKDDSGQGVAVDASGNAFVTIQSQNASGNYDFRTIKYAAADGSILWSKAFDGGGDDFAYQVAADAAGNAIVTGSSAGTNGDDWKMIVYAGADGSVLGQSSYNGSANGGDSAFNLVATNAGIYLAGVSTETGAAQSIRVMKLTPPASGTGGSTGTGTTGTGTNTGTTPPATGTPVNAALASNGTVVTASSQLNGSFPVSGINDGDRAGVNWTQGGGWADGTIGQWPDWAELDFASPMSLTSVVVYTVQDNWQNPVQPTDTMTFTQYGITDFSVQGWDGSQWVTLGTVTGNNLVKRTVTFNAFTTSKVRINVTGALSSLSRITEVEAWGTTATSSSASTPANVALATNGGVASASSQLSNDYPAVAINDGEHKGTNWTHGGGWADGSVSSWPDWVQVDFNGAKSLTSVVVYTVQDNYQSPVEPTDTTTFSQYGVTDFTVQGWDGTQWVTLGTVTGNNLVKRTVTFNAFTTTKIRINVAKSLFYLSRITEVEAWGVPAGPALTNVALASNGGTASASSQYDASYPVAAIVDGERAGSKWSQGGGWADGTAGQFPDWVEVDFNGTKNLSRVSVYTVQDNWQKPVQPTDTTTFSQYGLTDFTVQGWNGTQWVTLGTVSGNNLVKRTVTFNPFSTTKIRVNVTNAGASLSRITEVEAWAQ